jgi:hypothetical protein
MAYMFVDIELSSTRKTNPQILEYSERILANPSTLEKSLVFWYSHNEETIESFKSGERDGHISSLVSPALAESLICCYHLREETIESFKSGERDGHISSLVSSALAESLVFCY